MYNIHKIIKKIIQFFTFIFSYIKMLAQRLQVFKAKNPWTYRIIKLTSKTVIRSSGYGIIIDLGISGLSLYNNSDRIFEGFSYLLNLEMSTTKKVIIGTGVVVVVGLGAYFIKNQMDTYRNEKNLYKGNFEKVSTENQIFKKKCNNFENDIKLHKVNYNSLSTEHSQVTTEHNQVTTERNQLASDYSKLSTEHNQVTTERNQLASDYSKLSTEHNQVTTERNQLASDYSKLSTEHNQVTTERNQLASDYSKLSTEHNQVTTERNQLASDYSKLSTEHSKLASDYTHLDNGFFYYQQELNIINEENKLLVKRNQELEDYIENKQVITTIQYENMVLTNQDLIEENLILNEKVEQYENIVQSNAEIQQYNLAEVTNLTQMNNDLNEIVTDLTDSNDQLLHENRDLKNKHSSLLNEYENLKKKNSSNKDDLD